MNRKSFIRSFITLCAAPSVIAQVDEHKNFISIDIDNPVPQTTKIAAYFKISEQMLLDLPAMDLAYKQMEKNLVTAGGDLSKPYKIQIGYEDEDFVRNLKTCIIYQWI